MSILYIVRGLPGSGKSTLAKEIAATTGADHWEADQYFTDANGNYKWDGSKIGEAHIQCENNFNNSLEQNRNVVVSNTFTKFREFIDYIVYAQECKYDVVIIECLNNYGSVHNVPPETMERMRNRWEPNALLLVAKEKGTLKEIIDLDDISLFNSDEFDLYFRVCI